MKKSFFLISLIIFICTFAFAQASVDLFDPFYADVTMWENTGLINDAPSIRPYPLQEIERLLDSVIEKGDSIQQRKAEEYRSRFFGQVFHYGGRGEFNFASSGKEKQYMLAPFAKINYRVADMLTVSGYISFNLLNRLENNSVLPVFWYSNKDIANDAGNIGKLKILPMFNSSATFGTPEYYFTAGLGRTSLGPFHNSSIFISSQAFHAGQFMFVINKEKWAYNQVLLLLTATDNTGENFVPNKFLASHSLDIRPLPWLTFSIIDSMIYGGRFEPIYLIPFSAFFLGQSVYGFPDNSLLGLSTAIKPIEGLSIASELYVDDLGFNEIIKFKKDARWRLAGQLGISYTMPVSHWFSFADLSYTFVMPYMYTHVDHHVHGKPNYQNYTHHGEPLGSNLQPNSDRIQLKIKFRPIYGLDINFSNVFIRHANTTESITDIEMLKDYLARQYTTDGSIFNHPTITDSSNSEAAKWKNHAFLYSTPFMKQKTIQYINQLGLDVGCHLPIIQSGGEILFKIGYIFEANINPGVRNNIYRPAAAMNGWDAKSPDQLTDIEKAQIKAEADKQLSAWRAAARGRQFNHYIRLSAEVSY